MNTPKSMREREKDRLKAKGEDKDRQYELDNLARDLAGYKMFGTVIDGQRVEVLARSIVRELLEKYPGSIHSLIKSANERKFV